MFAVFGGSWGSAGGGGSSPWFAPSYSKTYSRFSIIYYSSTDATPKIEDHLIEPIALKIRNNAQKRKFATAAAVEANIDKNQSKRKIINSSIATRAILNTV